MKIQHLTILLTLLAVCVLGQSAVPPMFYGRLQAYNMGTAQRLAMTPGSAGSLNGTIVCDTNLNLIFGYADGAWFTLGSGGLPGDGLTIITNGASQLQVAPAVTNTLASLASLASLSNSAAAKTNGFLSHPTFMQPTNDTLWGAQGQSLSFTGGSSFVLEDGYGNSFQSENPAGGPEFRWTGGGGDQLNLVSGVLSLNGSPLATAAAFGQTLSALMVSNATGALAAPTNFFAANSNLLNQAVNNSQIIATNNDMSVNTGALPNLARALQGATPPCFLWFGDSTGDYFQLPLQQWLSSYSTNAGVQLGAPILGGAYWYPNGGAVSASPVVYVTNPTYLWGAGSTFTISAGTNVYWGGVYSPALHYAHGNEVQLWMEASASNGVASLYYSPDFVNWTNLGSLNEAALGKEGLLAVTNFAVPLGNYALKLACTSGTFRWVLNAGLIQTNCTVPIFWAFSAPGEYLQDWTNMGTNIQIILSNIAPCLTIEEQIKPLNTFNDYTNFAWQMSNYAPRSDVLLISTYASDPAAEAVSPPTNNTYAMALFECAVALTNGWPFVDTWHGMGTWYSITNNGFWAGNGPHLNTAGQMFLGQIVLQELNFPAIWSAQNQLTVPGVLTGAVAAAQAQTAASNAVNNLLGNLFGVPMVARWKLNNIPTNNGYIPDTINGYNLQNAAISTSGNQANFNGSSSFGYLPAPVIPVPFTISAWICSSNTLANYPAIISGGASGLMLRLNTSAQLDFLNMGVPVDIAQSAGTVPNNAAGFTQVALSYDGTHYAFYTNGVACGTGSSAQTITNPTFFLGSYNAGELFGGAMEDVMIFGGVLTPGQMNVLYQLGPQ